MRKMTQDLGKILYCLGKVNSHTPHYPHHRMFVLNIFLLNPNIQPVLRKYIRYFDGF